MKNGTIGQYLYDVMTKCYNYLIIQCFNGTVIQYNHKKINNTNLEPYKAYEDI